MPAIANGDAKRIYIAPDDHTDYFWSGGEDAYRQAFTEMIEYYLDLADETNNDAPQYQSRWNCDGSFWLWVYEQDRPNDFPRLINRIKDGHISAPLNALVVCLGGAPAEAVIRGMYYPGRLERKFDIRFRVAIAMENQTLPYGLISLWSGSGAQFSWKGICNCDTLVPSAWDREHEIYWAAGPDGSKVLMKWYSNLNGYQGIGTYAEARNTADSIEFVDADPEFNARYPYHVIGVFGKGWDDFKTLTDEFVIVAKNATNDSRRVFVSNQVDFFEDFYQNFGSSLPSVGCSFGNEWDLYCASLAETSAQIKRSVELLRAAEAMAAIVSENQPLFMSGRETDREKAWMALGLYWEHNFGMINPQVNLVAERIAWQKRLADDLQSYANRLHSEARDAIGQMIEKTGADEQVFVFNPLSWVRDGHVDYPIRGDAQVHVIDLASQEEVPSQMVFDRGTSYLRFLVKGIPAVGYKVFEIKAGLGQQFPDAAAVDGDVIESQYYRITVANRGAITSLEDISLNGRQFVSSMNSRAINDLGTGDGSLAIESSGPVSVTLKAVSSEPVAHTTRITVVRDTKTVFIDNEITQNFDDVITWGFGFDIANPDVWHEEVGAVMRAKKVSQGGHYSDRADNSRYDWLTINHYADMSNESAGVTISNADCYFMRLGTSTPDNLDTTTPTIDILSGGKIVTTGEYGLPAQGGDEYFLQRFAVQTHGEFDPIQAMIFSLEHQNPLVAGKITGGAGLPTTQYSYVQIDNPNIVLWALKPAEDGIESGTVVRLWNLSNTTQQFSLKLSDGPLVGAVRLSHIETPMENARIISGALADSMRPQQIKTYAVSTRTVLRVDQAFEEFYTPPVEATPTRTVAPTLAGRGEPDPESAASESTKIPQTAETAPATPLQDRTDDSAAQPERPGGKGCLLGLFGIR